MTATKKFPLSRMLLLSVFGLTISGCALPETSYPPTSLRNSVQIAETIERLELYSRPNGMSLSARDQDAVAHFLQNYGHHGDGPLYINVPSRPGAGVHETRTILTRMMSDLGMGGSAIQTGQYPVAALGPAPVVVSYRRLKSVPVDCSQELGLLTTTYNNQAYAGYGCVQTANLAAMIENPRQLIEPYPMTNPNMQRRMTVYDKYIEGENPASALPDRQNISAENE